MNCKDSKIVICGGGIMGSSVAYHLAKRGVPSVVAERCEPACAASGKAGGFLARDWCDSYELGPLARHSFDLHMDMAAEERFAGCEYRRLDTLSVFAKEQASSSASGSKAATVTGKFPRWVDGGVTAGSPLGTTQTTAQVHPHKLTHAMLQAAADMADTKVKVGTVDGISTEDSGGTCKVKGVKVNGEVMEADVVILTLGPWSHIASHWVKLPPVKGQRAHSVIVKPPPPGVTPHALFLEYRSLDGRTRSPEVYPRPDGTVYLCGMSDQEPLPDSPAQVSPDRESCRRLTRMAGEVSSALAAAEVQGEQACYLPISPDGLPLIGRVPDTEGVFVATGHSCWGILTAPATGEALVQLLLDGRSTVDLTPFDPARFY